MNFCRNIEDFKVKNPVVTIGTFDGVHLGHKQIINRLLQKAKEINGTPLIITFWPHPRIVLQQNEKPIFLLNTLDEKTQLFNNLGIDKVLVCPFTKEFSVLSPLDFVKKYLVEMIGLRSIIFGYDHHFGKNREGNFDNLQNYAKEWNFEIEKVEEYREGLTNISSTTIRRMLSEGELENANTLLGYNYFMTGIVTDGLRIGRKIGFPTANIIVDKNKLVPKQGVYAVKVYINNKSYNGVLNIGHKPTITENKLNTTIEVHIFDFDENIYKKSIQVEFIKYIRTEKKFDSIAELISQIENDIAICKSIIKI
ncbi:MAG TPA: riboflavin biosynthesis protein RibF [Bacteroidales bacterium]|nr:MAG: riboflavin biosynthesis protein RibF [Bacteroidetes bacterium GWF2_33_38]OFY75665.1 MAG: riboflavin biosynthesis protein RibF [Bacteroidetes bacterium RIFOXYA12_FULL_33_9]OFY89627.1 MAG: riboflavin biosynthesis protein RibF [Bacteroidetes bacterium RIFOXYA2_FULL_33_7]HBF89328.1 riboflavin biosynthesis protein RibF [Bacteroidales bacterium]